MGKYVHCSGISASNNNENNKLHEFCFNIAIYKSAFWGINTIQYVSKYYLLLIL